MSLWVSVGHRHFAWCLDTSANAPWTLSAIRLEAHWRGVLARKEADRRKWAVWIIQK